jgi:hypothetical protein
MNRRVAIPVGRRTKRISLGADCHIIAIGGLSGCKESAFGSRVLEVWRAESSIHADPRPADFQADLGWLPPETMVKAIRNGIGGAPQTVDQSRFGPKSGIPFR